MNDRLACKACGGQPCMCVTAECRACDGEGKVVRPGWIPPYNPVAESPPDPPIVTCEDCDGDGEITCSGPRNNGRCRFAPPPGIIPSDYYCYCEAAWERAQEAMLSEPPPSARERQERDYRERQALRSGRPL